MLTEEELEEYWRVRGAVEWKPSSEDLSTAELEREIDQHYHEFFRIDEVGPDAVSRRNGKRKVPASSSSNSSKSRRDRVMV